MPTTGPVKTLALLVDFQDYAHAAVNTRDYIHDRLFGTGNPASMPYESLKAYYSRSSYSRLDLGGGNTLSWYRTAGNRPVDPGGAGGRSLREDLLKEIIAHHDAQGHDFSQYDADGDGVIDYIIVIWSGPAGPWASLWWGCQPTFYDSSFTVDGKTLGKYSWQWEASPVGMAFTPNVVIHETGHALGLPDLYDYDKDAGPDGGVGKLDMMDANRGDHNCFSKWVIDWLTPHFVAGGTHSLILKPSGTSGNCVVVWPGSDNGDLFGEFFVAQNRQRVANDAWGMPGDGMLIWHVDASLDMFGGNYRYDNSFTEHKLVRLMEADGLEEIEQNG
ncbi:MAG: M6 family metalloprotease domain-containing protein [Deltaproteobacteria bacterium]|nr:M6 family metalloprotease domain-containing protein [Deltaproteobacteria bacterium]